MNEDDVKIILDKVYAIGFKNGQIEMKNKVLKSINLDWSLVRDAGLMVKLMKKISGLKLSKDFTRVTPTESKQ